jgi:hypothetical protein
MLHDVLLVVDKNNSYFEATILIGFVDSIWYVDRHCSFLLLVVAIVSCVPTTVNSILYQKKGYTGLYIHAFNLFFFPFQRKEK